MNNMNYIGLGVTKSDGFDKVTGHGMYVGDIKLNGMLHAKMKTSPYAHAKILKVDISKAQALPGVRSVITGETADYLLGLYLIDRPFMARGKVRYYGEPVAAVAADTVEIAQKAVELIEVEYEPLDVVQDVSEAIKPGATLVHEDLADYTYTKGVFFPEPGTNVASHIKIRKGNTDEAFAKADLIVENVFEQPQVFHVPIETHANIVQWGPNDQVKIYSSSQSPFAVRDLFTAAFKLPKTKVEVIVPYIGGGFGGDGL